MTSLGDRRAALLGTKDFQQIARELREVGDKKLQRSVSTAIRRVAKPIGEETVRDGAAKMPSRGGMADRVRGSKVSVASWFRGQNPHIDIRLRNRHSLRQLDRGTLRHPVFARADQERKQWTWVSQSVPAGAFSKPFQSQARQVRDEALKAAHQVLDDIKGSD